MYAVQYARDFGVWGEDRMSMETGGLQSFSWMKNCLSVTHASTERNKVAGNDILYTSSSNNALFEFTTKKEIRK
jgi:hypothetical protein